MILDADRTLVIVAHPDDETLGAGGTIRRLVDAGGTVDLLVATDGSSAQFGTDLAARDRRDRHMRAACGILGIGKIVKLDFPDMRLDQVPHVDLNVAIAEVVAAGRYDTVLTHHPGDVNLDHRMVFRSVMVVARPVPGAHLRCVATFFINSSTEWGAQGGHAPFLPNVFVDISGTVDAKTAALQAYKDELREWPHPRSTRAVADRAAVTGSEVGVAAAEAFQLIRALG